MVYIYGLVVLLSGSYALFGGDDIQYRLTCSIRDNSLAYQLFEGDRFIAVSPDLKSLEDKHPNIVSRALQQQEKKCEGLEYSLKDLAETNARLIHQNRCLSEQAEKANGQAKEALRLAQLQEKIFEQRADIKLQLIEALAWYQKKFRTLHCLLNAGIVLSCGYVCYTWYQSSGHHT